MRAKISTIKNLIALSEAGETLRNRAPGLPRMGLVWGPTGYGKTTASAWWRNRINGVHVRARAVWTPSAMLAAIVHELGGAPSHSCARTMDDIVELLSLRPRPVLIDEADYIVRTKKMVETLRDLHDETASPVILIGMDGIERAIKRWRQLTGRIAAPIGFKRADFEDAQKLCTDLSEVPPEPALLEQLYEKARGSVRLIVVGLSGIEDFGRTHGLAEVTAKQWNQRPFFFGLAPDPGSGEDG